ncbi:hypothetical protein GGI35DRAFT_336308 [Trichoderma velutinum]
MAGEERMGNATPDSAANLKRLRIVVTVRRSGAPRTKWANDGDGRSQREQGWRPSSPGLIKVAIASKLIRIAAASFGSRGVVESWSRSGALGSRHSLLLGTKQALKPGLLAWFDDDFWHSSHLFSQCLRVYQQGPSPEHPETLDLCDLSRQGPDGVAARRRGFLCACACGDKLWRVLRRLSSSRSAFPGLSYPLR